jgi:hypothetical protein
LRRRLLEGYTPEDLLDAIASVRDSPEDYCLQEQEEAQEVVTEAITGWRT